jgi:hypothetical protein
LAVAVRVNAVEGQPHKLMGGGYQKKRRKGKISLKKRVSPSTKSFKKYIIYI